MKARFALVALSAMAFQVCHADFQQNFETPAGNTSLASAYSDSGDALSNWKGSGTVTEGARAASVPSIGSAIVSNVDSTKFLAVDGEVHCTNAVVAVASKNQADFLIFAAEPSDILEDNDSDFVGTQVGVAVGTNLVNDAYVPLYVCCSNGVGSSTWVQTDALIPTGQWVRVSLVFDYSKTDNGCPNGMCRVVVDGVPAASGRGYATVVNEYNYGRGAWYPIPVDTVGNSVDQLDFFGITKIDDVSLGGSELAFLETGKDVTIGRNRSDDSGGGATNVLVSALNTWGVSTTTIHDAKLDETDLTIEQKLAAGLDPMDGNYFTVNSVGLNAAGTQVTVGVQGVPNTHWYKITFEDPSAVEPLATLSYDAANTRWQVESNLAGTDKTYTGITPTFAQADGKSTITVTLPEAVATSLKSNYPGCKIKTHVVPVNN